jgi:hypothetical protein
VTAGATDVHRILAYGTERVTKQLLGMALALFAVGVGDVVYFDAPRFPGWPVMIIGLGWMLWEFWRLHNPGKPLLTLSPDGLRLYIVGVKEVLIPWQEVKAVSLIDMEVSTRHVRPAATRCACLREVRTRSSANCRLRSRRH